MGGGFYCKSPVLQVFFNIPIRAPENARMRKCYYTSSLPARAEKLLGNCLPVVKVNARYPNRFDWQTNAKNALIFLWCPNQETVSPVLEKTLCGTVRWSKIFGNINHKQSSSSYAYISQAKDCQHKKRTFHCTLTIFIKPARVSKFCPTTFKDFFH